ncbi:S1 family peptidase [Renibacterium salmoninarum]|uniref:S1 family peptidase n=1 Tax=Renibacterium salmoninarum TaxID=1646 RepID=UPI000DF8214E|nr:S1 family peptidase [Renibacterium salmoninarum]
MKTSTNVRKACLSGLATVSLLAVTFGATAFGAANANAADPADPVQAAVNYLVEQGVNRDAAQHRIDTQAARGELATKLDSILGSHGAGAYTDFASGELTASVTDDAGAALASAQGIRSVRVANSLAQLQSVSDQLAATFDSASGARWSISPVTNSVNVTLPTATTATPAQQAVLDASSSVIKISKAANAAHTSAGTAAYGGQRYLFDSDRYTCSIGFFSKSNNDASDIKIVQAGHCTTTGGPVSKDKVNLGNDEDSSFGSGSSTDYGLIDVNTANFTGKGAVDKYDGTYLSVKGSTNVAVGDTICKSGQKTKWKCSKVLSTNASVSYQDEGVTLKNMIQTNGCTIPGDSGGSNLSGNYAAGMTSGGNLHKTSQGSPYCASQDGDTDETYLQKVGPALQAYGVSLLTS